MREEVRDPLRLQHIREACKRLIEFFPTGDVPELNEKDMAYFGLIKNLEIIGEAAYKLTQGFVNDHPEIDWRSIIAMRHVMVHGYYKVNPAVVKEIIEAEIPDLFKQINNYLETEQQN